MKNMRKSIRTITAILLLAATTSLTSCDVMMGVLGGMALGMASYNPYGYTPYYGSSTNNNYLLDPNYAIMQTQQQQAQMNQVQQQLINQSIQQTNRDMEELNRVNQQLIETSVWQAEHGINLGGTGENNSKSTNQNAGIGNTTATTQPNTHKCGLCGGSGEWAHDAESVPDFGTGNKYCSKCGKTVGPKHVHTRCPSCEGKGYW